MLPAPILGAATEIFKTKGYKRPALASHDHQMVQLFEKQINCHICEVVCCSLAVCCNGLNQSVKERRWRSDPYVSPGLTGRGHNYEYMYI